MNRGRQAGFAILGLPLLVSACVSDTGKSTRDLLARLDTRLSPDIAANRVAVEPLPDGARLTVPDAALFPRGGTQISGTGDFMIVSVVQSLLDPSLMQVQVSGDPSTPGSIREDQVHTVASYFPAQTLQPVPSAPPPPVSEPAAAPGILTILINVVARPPQPET